MSYEDDLAYGEYHGEGGGGESERGFVGDVFRRIRGKNPQVRKPSTRSQAGSAPRTRA